MNLKCLIILICAVTSNVYCENKNEIKIKDIRHYLAAELLKSTLNTTTNTVIGVLPLQFALCKLASVATGQARKELLKILGFHNQSRIHTFYQEFYSQLAQFQMTDLLYLNKIYVDYNKPIDPGFIQNSLATYGVYVEKVGFNYPKSAASFINKEVSSITLRRVENVVGPSNVTNETSVLLVTAAHCKPTWETPFNHQQTKIRSFRLLDNQRVDVPMMMKAESCLIYDAKDFRVVKLNLLSSGCSIAFIQPDFLTLDRIIWKLQDPAFMTNIKRKMIHRQVRLVVPRIKIKSHLNLNEYLRNLGLKEILSKNTTGLNAILSEINNTNENNIFVSNVLQKFFIEIDEFGFSRVDKYARLGYNAPTREPPAMIEVVLDRPFYFSINLEIPTEDAKFNDVHELFTGVYYKPDI